MKTIQIKNPSEIVIERTKILFIVIALFFALQSNAQLSVSININANTNRVYETEQRHVHVHDSRCGHREVVEYYYYPEIEVYFDINTSAYLYYTSNGWVRSRYLPRHCSHYDFQRGYRVGLDYHGQRPYTHYHNHKKMYKAKKKHYYADNHYKGKHKGHKKH